MTTTQLQHSHLVSTPPIFRHNKQWYVTCDCLVCDLSDLHGCAWSFKTRDPTANLTFDLTLSEREREERDRLILPYHHSAEQKTALLQVYLVPFCSLISLLSFVPAGWLWEGILPARRGWRLWWFRPRWWSWPLTLYHKYHLDFITSWKRLKAV